MKNIKRSLNKDNKKSKKPSRFDNKNGKMLQAASTISSFPIVIIILICFNVNIILIGLAVIGYIWTIILEIIQIKKSFKE